MDTLEGDSEGHIRFKTPEEAQAVVNDRSAAAKEHGWTLDLLSGENRFLRDTKIYRFLQRLITCITFRAFSRRFYPKLLTISTFVSNKYSHVYVLALMFFVISLGDHHE